MYSLEFDVNPIAKGRPRFSRKSGVAFTPAKTRHAEAELRWLIAKKWKEEQGMGPLQGPLMVILDFVFIRPKSVSAKKRPHHIVKPDCSNLVKTIEDSGNGLLWTDDCQIISLHVRKYYSNESKIRMTLEVLE